MVPGTVSVPASKLDLGLVHLEHMFQRKLEVLETQESRFGSSKVLETFRLCPWLLESSFKGDVCETSS